MHVILIQGAPFNSISDAQGNLVVQEVAVKPLTQDLLRHEVSYRF